ncbi:hypothetical protein GCM10027180_13700 [Microbulbifer echini]
MIYTTNSIESLNRVIRKATNQRKVFLSDDSAIKAVYSAMQSAAKKWAMPIRNWKSTLTRFMIEFGERLTDYQ